MKDINTSINSVFLGIPFDNPFVLASAPPTANADMISRAFEAGWSGAVIKTITRETVHNVHNRFATNKIKNHVYAFENIELLSERLPEEWFADIEILKKRFPDKIIIGSVMGDAKDKMQWQELTLGCQEAGADMVELNFSCPHGYPERGRGSAIGQNPDYSANITSRLKEDKKIKIPVIPKLTAAVADIQAIGEAVANTGADGICAINTFPSLMGFDLKGLSPKASVNKHSTAGGYSGAGLKPIALRCVSDLAKRPNLPIMACGGVSSGFDAAEFMLLGAPIVQICTAVMLEGYNVIDRMVSELKEFMEWHNFSKIEDFLGLGNELICNYSDLDRAFKVKATIDSDKCNGCGKCFVSCRDGGYQAIEFKDKIAAVLSDKCKGCSLCYQVCPSGAVRMVPNL